MKYSNSEYPYLYETHLHTNRSSRCGISTPEEQVRAAKEAGYAGIFITEHNWGGNCAVDRSLPWEEFMTQFCQSYHEAKAVGDAIGLDVFFAMEAGFHGTEFLTYGVDEEWYKNHPEAKTESVEEYCRMVRKDGGLIIHAHPYREAPYLKEIRLFPEEVDGVEGFNGSHDAPLKGEGHPEFNQRALAYAEEHHLPVTAGSDAHVTKSLISGVAFKKKLTCVQDYVDAIKNGEDYILVNNGELFDKYGQPLK